MSDYEILLRPVFRDEVAKMRPQMCAFLFASDLTVSNEDVEAFYHRGAAQLNREERDVA